MIDSLRTYNVSASARKPLVDFMLESLRAAGCRILFNSDPHYAPFIITFETASGERMGVVAYAFLVTRTPTNNRPQDERSFQIKYGKKQKDNIHDLWSDPLGLYITLLLGIDPVEGFFVAADAAMHTPTKFFIRLEFKDEHVAEIKRNGWYAWERQRRAGPLPEPVEVLVGGTRDTFLDLVRFERAAHRLSPGDRQLLAEKRELFTAAAPTTFSVTRSQDLIHPLSEEFQLGEHEILELITSAKRLKMAVRGWVAEEHLKAAIASVRGVTKCERLDQEGGPDLYVSYKQGPILAIECKNVLRKTDGSGLPRVDFQRTRASQRDPCSRFYAPEDFDIVASCLHAVTERWEFRYNLTRNMAPHVRCPGKLTNNVRVGPDWLIDPVSVFEAAYARLK